MLRINVLTEKKKKKKKRAIIGPVNFLVTVSIVAVLALLVMGGITAFVKYKVSNLRAETEANKKKIAELDKQVVEVRKQEEMKQDMIKRNTLIDDLSKSQTVPVMVIDSISSLMPEGVWLTSVAFDDKGINVEGVAFSNSDIVTYVVNMKNKFNDVYLIETKQAEIEKVPVYSFKINCKVKG